MTFLDGLATALPWLLIFWALVAAVHYGWSLR